MVCVRAPKTPDMYGTRAKLKYTYDTFKLLSNLFHTGLLAGLNWSSTCGSFASYGSIVLLKCCAQKVRKEGGGGFVASFYACNQLQYTTCSFRISWGLTFHMLIDLLISLYVTPSVKCFLTLGVNKGKYNKQQIEISKCKR